MGTGVCVGSVVMVVIGVRGIVATVGTGVVVDVRVGEGVCVGVFVGVREVTGIGVGVTMFQPKIFRKKLVILSKIFPCSSIFRFCTAS